MSSKLIPIPTNQVCPTLFEFALASVDLFLTTDKSGARVHELSAPLASAGISILYQSSYMSDFIFVSTFYPHLSHTPDVIPCMECQILYTCCADDTPLPDISCVASLVVNLPQISGPFRITMPCLVFASAFVFRQTSDLRTFSAGQGTPLNGGHDPPRICRIRPLFLRSSKSHVAVVCPDISRVVPAFECHRRHFLD